MLALARRKVAAEDPEVAGRVRLIRGNLDTFAVPGPYSLALVAVKSFMYLTTRAQQQQALARIGAHLAPGGTLALDLLHPTPAWLAQRPGELWQDLVQELPDGGVVTRTETVVEADHAEQLRLMRSIYDLVGPDGATTRRVVEWPLRYVFRHEAELLLEAAGFEVESVRGGYAGEPLTELSPSMVVVARRS
jgi:O-methyltransferase involved in polyketide biosynthesis